ncbi:hypothetical protein AB0H83_18415 [Dactylosporangium sp. NPDC050688]|uniref:hypothetical protein n=1 Tax=Dactylosporangium sp. NPDC050688 TaxID=3157217 RepID=UPI0033C897F8
MDRAIDCAHLDEVKELLGEICGSRQYDWWLSVTDLDALVGCVTDLMALSNLHEALWSNDPVGDAVLQNVKAGRKRVAATSRRGRFGVTSSTSPSFRICRPLVRGVQPVPATEGDPLREIKASCPADVRARDHG